MGMTGVAYATSYEATYANPAGLAAQERLGFTFGLQGGVFRLQVDDERSSLDPYQGATLGFHLPVPFGGSLADVFVIGAGFFTPSNAVLQTDIIFPELPNFVLLGRSQSVHIQLGLGIDLRRWVPGLKLGLGVATLASIGGRLQVEVDDANQFIAQTETQILANFNPIAGVQLDVGDFTFGLVYREKIQAEIDLAIRVQGLQVEVPIITITAIPQYDPHTLAFETAWRPNPHWLVAAQLVYRRWSTYPGVVGRTTSMSDQPPAPDFRDTVAPRVGLEWSGTLRRTTLELRGGYAFEPTPAKPAREAPTRDFEGNPLMSSEPLRYLDNHRHIVTLGSSIVYESDAGAVIRFDLFTQLHVLQPRTHEIPASERAGDGVPNLRTSGLVWSGGWGATFEW